jgi:hypothetical protein
MTYISRKFFRFALVLLTVLPLLLLGIHDASAKRGPGGGGGDDDGGNGGGGHEVLKLRVNDAIGKPGGTVALVLRTYAARPIRQGQISLRIRKGRAGAGARAQAALTYGELTQPVRPVTLLRTVVFSVQGDVVPQANLTGAPDSQALQVAFTSPSGTVNAADGPLAVLFLRLDPAVSPGQVYTIEVDPAVTGLTDAAGQPVTLDPINAELTVRAPSAPYAVEAEGDEVEPGETAELGVQTFEPFAVSSGRITLRYNRNAGLGRPVVTMDPRYGKATFQVVRWTPGLLVVAFQSPNGTLNTVPGRIVGIDLRTRPTAQIGTETQVSLDPKGSWLMSKNGKRKLPLKMEGGTIAFR